MSRKNSVSGIPALPVDYTTEPQEQRQRTMLAHKQACGPKIEQKLETNHTLVTKMSKT